MMMPTPGWGRFLVSQECPVGEFVDALRALAASDVKPDWGNDTPGSCCFVGKSVHFNGVDRATAPFCRVVVAVVYDEAGRKTGVKVVDVTEGHP